MLIYPATFEKDGDYIFVQFPDVPGAFTQGATLAEAYEKASEVLGLMLENQNEFPTATDITLLQKKFPQKTIALVGIDLPAFRKKYMSKTIRKNVTVPEWLSEMAEEQHINFSATLTEALKEKLGV